MYIHKYLYAIIIHIYIHIYVNILAGIKRISSSLQLINTVFGLNYLFITCKLCSCLIGKETADLHAQLTKIK